MTGQACAVAVASAIFQRNLLYELRLRIHGSNAEQVKNCAFYLLWLGYETKGVNAC